MNTGHFAQLDNMIELLLKYNSFGAAQWPLKDISSIQLVGPGGL